MNLGQWSKPRKGLCNYVSNQKMPLTASQIAVALKEAREEAGLSQAAAAATAGVDAMTISRYERAERRPKRPMLLLLADTYGVQPERFGEPSEPSRRRASSVPRETNRLDRSTLLQQGSRGGTREPRHLANLPLEIRVFLDEFRLRLTKAHATEEEVDRAMALLRSRDIFSYFSTGEPKDLPPDKVLKTMKAIAEHVIVPELRERGRKL